MEFFLEKLLFRSEKDVYIAPTLKNINFTK